MKRSSTFEKFDLILNEKNLVGESFNKIYSLYKYSCKNFKLKFEKKTVIRGKNRFFKIFFLTF